MREETLERLTFVCGYLAGVTSAVRDDTNTAIATNDHVEVIRHYAALRQATKQIKEAREALDEIEERLSREHVPDVMRAAGIRNTTIEGVGRVTLSNRWSCSMVDKEAGIDWLRNNGHDSLIIETVNSSTLAAFAKDMSLEHGFDLPDNLFRTAIMTYTSITKA